LKTTKASSVTNMLSRQCLSNKRAFRMSEDSTTQCLLFPGILRKPIVAQFDQREGSSDGGALLLKAADRHYDLVAGLSSCLRDDRQAGKVDHSLRELVAQRVFSIACGYPDANDSARLSGDPIHKLLLDRDPIEGRDLASQPTLSRFENGVGVKELYRAGELPLDSLEPSQSAPGHRTLPHRGSGRTSRPVSALRLSCPLL
jgi:Transposase DDE domain group 1